MLDLETLSTRTDAAIIQIAARAFDPQTGELGAVFDVYVRDSAGHVGVQTVAWWMQRGAAAYNMGAKLIGPDAESERGALRLFTYWLEAHAPACEALWSHGATFDIPLLAAAYGRHGLGVPWYYRAPRDTRTLYALAPGGVPALPKDPAREHCAVYDCEYQISQVCAALKALRTQADPTAARTPA